MFTYRSLGRFIYVFFSSRPHAIAPGRSLIAKVDLTHSVVKAVPSWLHTDQLTAALPAFARAYPQAADSLNGFDKITAHVQKVSGHVR